MTPSQFRSLDEAERLEMVAFVAATRKMAAWENEVMEREARRKRKNANT